MVSKASLVESIALLVKSKKIEGVTDLRDESDRDGMRIVLELKRDAVEDVVLNQLYHHTQMETTFGVINLALLEDNRGFCRSRTRCRRSSTIGSSSCVAARSLT